MTKPKDLSIISKDYEILLKMKDDIDKAINVVILRYPCL